MEAYKTSGLTPETGLHGELRNTAHKTEKIFAFLHKSISENIANKEFIIYIGNHYFTASYHWFFTDHKLFNQCPS